MFKKNRRYNQQPIVVPIVDQTNTFQCLIPMGDLSKYDWRGHASPSGYGPIGLEQISFYMQNPKKNACFFLPKRPGVLREKNLILEQTIQPSDMTFFTLWFWAQTIPRFIRQTMVPE